MGVVTRRPDTAVTSTPGNWTKVTSTGQTVAQILSDDSDLTYMSIATPSTLPQNLAKFGIVDLTTADVPASAKIKSVTARAKVLQIAPVLGSSFFTDLLRLQLQITEEVTDLAAAGGLGDFIIALFHHLASFLWPTPPGGASPTWQYLSKTFTSTPSGGELTVAAINAFTYYLTRGDPIPITIKVSEYYLDVEFNLAPVLNIIGPTETRVVTDGATTNTSTTLTSATAAFTSNDVGAAITGTGIPALTTIASVTNATTVVLSAAATATATGVTVTVVRTVVTTTSRPIITTTYDDTEGDLQSAIRFRIFTAAQAALGSFNVETTPPFAKSIGVEDYILGQSRQWLCNRDLPNGDYVVYAQAKQEWSGPTPHVSQWDAYTFTMNAPAPISPDLVAAADPVNSWTQLDVSTTDNTPPVETYNFYSSDDSGITWQLVWDGWQVDADEFGNATLVDYLGPLNQARQYKALSYTTVGGIKIASSESNIAVAVAAYHEFALKDPFAPSLNQPIGWMDDDPGEESSQGVHIPLVADGQKAYAIVVEGPLQGITGDSKMLFIDPDDEAWEKWKAIRAARHTLLLQYPTGEQHWIRIKGAPKWSWRTDGDTGVDFRILEWGYIEVKAPRDPGAPVSAQGVQ